MATVIDSLVVEFGLDPRKFTAGQRAAIDQIRRLKDESRRGASEAEENAQAVGAQMLNASAKVAGFVAAFLGMGDVKKFVEQTARANAEVGRTANVMGMSTERLSAWRGVAERTGGTADGVTGSIASLVNKFADFSLTLQNDTLPYFRALNIDLTKFLDASGRVKDPTSLMLEISKKFHEQIQSGKMTASQAGTFGRAFGFDAETINLLLRGDKVLGDLLEKQARIRAVTQDQADNAQQLVSAWEGLNAIIKGIGDDITNYISKPIADALKALTALLSWGRKKVPEVGKGVAGSEAKGWVDWLAKQQQDMLLKFVTPEFLKDLRDEVKKLEPEAPVTSAPPKPAPTGPGGAAPSGVSRGGVPLTTITTAGGKQVQVAADAAADFKGFLDALEAKGAPIGSMGGYNYRNIAGTNTLSQHAHGKAVDMGSMTGRDQIDPALRNWINANPAEWRKLLAEYNMRSGGDWKNPDLGHVEWRGRRQSGAATAAPAGGSQAGAAVAAPSRSQAGAAISDAATPKNIAAPQAQAGAGVTAQSYQWTDNRTGGSTVTNQTRIEAVNVDARGARDAESIARGLPQAIQRQSMAGNANFGGN